MIVTVAPSVDAVRLCGRSLAVDSAPYPRHLPSVTGGHGELTPVLLYQLFVYPLLKIGFALVNRHLAAHLVVPPSAELRADQLELSRRV